MGSSSASTVLCLPLSLSCFHQCIQNNKAELNGVSVKWSVYNLSLIYLSINHLFILHLPIIFYIYLPSTFLSDLSSIYLMFTIFYILSIFYLLFTSTFLSSIYHLSKMCGVSTTCTHCHEHHIALLTMKV